MAMTHASRRQMRHFDALGAIVIGEVGQPHALASEDLMTIHAGERGEKVALSILHLQAVSVVAEGTQLPYFAQQRTNVVQQCQHYRIVFRGSRCIERAQTLLNLVQVDHDALLRKPR